MVNKKRAIAYVRVSTTDQKDRGYSLPDQRDKITRFCENADIEIIQFFEEDYSAKTFDRPEFNKLKAFAKRHKKEIDHLLFIKWDRFSRDVFGAYAMLSEFEKLGIECQAIEQWLDYKIPENNLMLSLYIAQPMVDNHRRSLNTKNGMRRAQKSGRYMATAPIGYKNSRDEQSKSMIILDSTIVHPSGKSKSELLRELFYDFATGNYQQEEIRIKYWRKGLRIPRSRIRPTLENPVYMGKVKIKAYEDEPEQIVHGLHDPLISEKLFNKVDDVLNKPKEDKSKYSKRSSDFPLRGEISCRSCNKPLTGSFSKGKSGNRYGYYHCIHPCKSRVRNNKVDEWVESTLNKIKPSKEVVALYQEVLKKELRLKNGDIEKELKNIESQISTLKTKLKSIDEKFIDDLIDAETYKTWKTNFGKELADFEQRKEQIQMGFNQTLKDLQKAAQLITELPKLYKQAEPKDKKTIVSSIFSENLSVEKNDIQTPQFNQVIELICTPALNKRGFKNKKGNAQHEHSRWVTSERFKLPTS